MKRSQLKKLIKEEISNASTIDLAGKIRTLVYSTPFWKFRDAINMVLKSHYNKKVQLAENKLLNESLELTPIERRKLIYFLEMKVEEMQNKGDNFFSDEIEIFNSILNKIR